MKKFIAMLMTAAMLAASVFQTVSFAAFSDVSEDHQYKNAITTLSTLSVIAGYEDGTFKPDGAITRAEFTKL
ncbi:MAG: S-layer homology domain-containing protein, partial [Clostridia bacterium]|nr:S-layer homology domain-containing protein [Clostridia bacterium]